MPEITQQDIDRAVTVLSRSGRGLKVMRDALAMLDGGAICLDEPGQEALFTLLTAAMTSHAGSARDAMREALR